MQRTLILCALIAGISAAMSMQWQDCNLEADQPLLLSLDCRHAPDPIVSTKTWFISKTFYNAKTTAITSLVEDHLIDQRNADGSWTNIRNVTDLDHCMINPGLCPIPPQSEFKTLFQHDNRTTIVGVLRARESFRTQNSTTGKWFTIGCTTVVYEAVKGSN